MEITDCLRLVIKEIWLKTLRVLRFKLRIHK